MCSYSYLMHMHAADECNWKWWKLKLEMENRKEN